MPHLISVADLIMGQSPPSTTYNETGKGLPFFQGKTDFGSRHPTPRLFCSAPVKTAQPKDILMSIRAPVGPTNVADRECCIGRGLAAIRPREIDGEFLLFNLRYLESSIASLGSGSTFHAINKTQLGAIEVNERRFGRAEQRRIAEMLELVHRAIEQQERMLKLTTELKKALLHQLFTKGLRNEPQKQTEIGPIPQSWGVATCLAMCDLITVGVVVRPASHYVPSGVPAFRSLNVREDRLETDHLVHFSQSDNDTVLAKSKLRRGDVLVVRTGYPGTSCVVPPQFDGANCIDLVILRPKNDFVSSGFLSRFFNSPAGKRQARAGKHGLAQQHLNVGAVKSMLIPIPSLAEQHEIDSALRTIQHKLEFHRRKQSALSVLFNTLLHQLMTAQIRISNLERTELKGTV